MKTIIKLLSSQWPTHRSGHNGSQFVWNKILGYNYCRYYLSVFISSLSAHITISHMPVLAFGTNPAVWETWHVMFPTHLSQTGQWTTVLGIFVKLLGTEAGIPVKRLYRRWTSERKNNRFGRSGDIEAGYARAHVHSLSHTNVRKSPTSSVSTDMPNLSTIGSAVPEI